MKKKAVFLKICAALAVASFFAVGCSDDSSATSGDDFIDRGEVNLPIPTKFQRQGPCKFFCQGRICGFERKQACEQFERKGNRQQF